MKDTSGMAGCICWQTMRRGNLVKGEMVKCGRAAFRECFLSLIHTVSEEGSVPQAWKDANLVPIPKKGDLSYCDNWRGIALLNVAGKVAGWLVQNILQQIGNKTYQTPSSAFVEVDPVHIRFSDHSEGIRTPHTWLRTVH